MKSTKKRIAKRGTNQYQRKLHGLKTDTWISILFICSIAFFLIGVLFLLKAMQAPTVVIKIEGSKPAKMEGGPVIDMSHVYAPDDAYSLDEIVHHVAILESSDGANGDPRALHNVCARQGKANLWGYGGMQSMICFASYEEGESRVKRWFAEHLTTMPLRTALCRYAYGGYPENCTYAEKFFAIAL